MHVLRKCSDIAKKYNWVRIKNITAIVQQDHDKCFKDKMKKHRDFVEKLPSMYQVSHSPNILEEKCSKIYLKMFQKKNVFFEVYLNFKLKLKLYM